jgi:hypothetical protein
MNEKRISKKDEWMERLVKDYKLPIEEETKKSKRILSDKQLQIVKSKE